MCRQGVSGTRCDSCSRGRCDSFPACELCPNCFFTLDFQQRNISLALDKLSFRFPSLPGGAGDLGNFGPRIRLLEGSLNQIKETLSRPPNTVTPLDDALLQLDELREQLEKVDNDLPSSVRDPGLESELDKLRDLLENITLNYNAKKETTEDSIGPDIEVLNTIKNAYDESTAAAEKVKSTENTVKDAKDIQEETKDIQDQVQPNNTRDLSTLKHNMSSQPDLTPVAKQVCGSVRSEPCTPLQCVGEALCPPEGSPACKNGTACVGALPLSRKADDDVMDVKDRLGKLSVKITEAAETLQNTQEKTEEVRQLVMDLSSKTKKARDTLEEESKEMRNVVKELKDFLSDPSSNLTKVQEISEWILKAKLPITLKTKLEELKNLTANLPSTMNVLKEATPQLETARKLLQEARDTRDKALKAEDDVSELLELSRSGNDALVDLEEKLQDSLDLISNLNDNLTQAEAQLSPAEKALSDTETVMTPMKPRLDALKKLLQEAQQKAPDALNTAEEAEEEAAAAEPDLKILEEQLDRLRDKADSGGTGETAPVADRLGKLHEKAAALANTTLNMTQALEGKAESLRSLQDEITQKSAKLEGLEDKLKDILKALRKRAEEFRTCG